MMSDFPNTPERWRDVLDTALEHGSHAWAALEKMGYAHRVADDGWPPTVDAPVGSAAYHFAAMTRYVWEVFQGLAIQYPDDEQEEHIPPPYPKTDHPSATP